MKRYLTASQHKRIVERHYKQLNDLEELAGIKTLDANLKKNIKTAFTQLKKCSKLLDLPLKLGLGLKAPAKGLTVLCAKQVGVTGRRKKDGTQKKGYVASKGGKLIKKKLVSKKK